MATREKNDGGLSGSGKVIDKTQLAQIRAEKAAPTISKREVDKLFSTAGARHALAVQKDIAAFGSLVRNLRRNAGFTQAELAKKSGVSRATIANLEAGGLDGGPRLETLAGLARACGEQLLPYTSPVTKSMVGANDLENTK